jgi:hypothetical protein
MNREGWLSGAVRLYRLLLGLYPNRFRESYGQEMVELLVGRLERVRDRGRWALAALILVSLADLAWSAALERASSLRRGRRLLPRRDGILGRALPHLRLSCRSLARQPGLVIVVVLMLALGTRATLALFTIADGALMRPLPYPRPERLVSIVQADSQFGFVAFAPPTSPTCASVRGASRP